MNIPFALLSAVLLLWATGQTINIMTLGGLALAVGVLVDEATVSIENTHTSHGARRFTSASGGSGRQSYRNCAIALDVLHSRGVRSLFLHDRREPATLRALVPGRRLFDDRFVPVFEQSRAGVLHLAYARGT